MTVTTDALPLTLSVGAFARERERHVDQLPNACDDILGRELSERLTVGLEFAEKGLAATGLDVEDLQSRIVFEQLDEQQVDIVDARYDDIGAVASHGLRQRLVLIPVYLCFHVRLTAEHVSQDLAQKLRQSEEKHTNRPVQFCKVPQIRTEMECSWLTTIRSESQDPSIV